MEKSIQNFSKVEAQVRAEITEAIQGILGSADEIEIEHTPENKLGDYTVPCFLLAKTLKKSPADVASEITASIKPGKLIEKAEAAGPYVNFFINREVFSKLALTEIYKEEEKYGSSKVGKGQRVMVEYFSPNTNKPLTIGHVRNIVLGQSISNILKFTSHKVTQVTIYNDRGIAIVKAILGYQKWSDAKTPKDAGLKPDHFVGDYYVRFSQKEKEDENLTNEAKRGLQAWEEDDPKIRKVWQQLMIWVLDGFKQTLKKLGVEKFDEEYYESEFYAQGKEVVEQGLKQGIFVKDDEGVTVAKLEKYGMPDKILLRPDGTSLYMTQDLQLAYLKDKYNLDKSIYVVASEQDLHFKQLFKMLELLGFENAKNYYHLSYGMIRLPGGRIKSREGLASGTGADDLINQLEEIATSEIKQRFPELAEKEVTKRAENIAISALKFYILLVNPKTTMVFDPKKSIAFTGKTGPYLQYTHARINSIFTKAGMKPSSRVDFSLINTDEEFDLIKTLAKFPTVIQSAVEKYDPSQISVYLHDLAQQFSLFYESSPILKSDDKTKKARLLIAHDVQVVLATGLGLLGIKPIEKM